MCRRIVNVILQLRLMVHLDILVDTYGAMRFSLRHHHRGYTSEHQCVACCMCMAMGLQALREPKNGPGGTKRAGSCHVFHAVARYSSSRRAAIH